MLDQLRRLVSPSGPSQRVPDGGERPVVREKAQSARGNPLASSRAWYNGPLVPYDEWLQVSKRAPATRCLSATPKPQLKTAVYPMDYPPPMTLYGRQSYPHRGLVLSRSMDSIHPHLVKPRAPKAVIESPRDTASTLRDWWQRIKDSSGKVLQSAPKKTDQPLNQHDRSSADDWLLHRPSPKTVQLKQPCRPTTPGASVFRKIFHSSSNPPESSKRPSTPSRFLNWRINKSESTSTCSSSRHKVCERTRSNSFDVAKVYKILGEPPNVVHHAGIQQTKDQSLPSVRGDPDGATFPRETESLWSESQPEISKQAVKQHRSPAPKRLSRKKQHRKPSFRIKRRQLPQRKFPPVTTGDTGRNSALAGAKLVSEWTYLQSPDAIEHDLTTEVKESPPSLAQDEDGDDDDEWRSNLYQVLVDRPRRVLPPPMWDPVIFVPPERRRNSAFTTMRTNSSSGASKTEKTNTFGSRVSETVRNVQKVRRTRSSKRPRVVVRRGSQGTSSMRKSRRAHKDGDITQKGYEKKKSRLLAPYVSELRSGGQQHQQLSVPKGGGGGGVRSRAQGPSNGEGDAEVGASPGSRERRRSHRRVTRHESRYHSEVRQEAVQQALAAMQNRPKPSLPMPSKRTSVMAKSPDRELLRDSESSSDDDSAAATNEGSSSLVSTPERDRAARSNQCPPQSHNAPHGYAHHELSDTSSTGSARDTPPAQRPLPALPVSPPPPKLPPREHRDHSAQRTPRLANGAPWPAPSGPVTNLDDNWLQQDQQQRRPKQRGEITDISDVMANLMPYSEPPDVTNNTNIRRSAPADRLGRYGVIGDQGQQRPGSLQGTTGQPSTSPDESTGTLQSVGGRWKVSAKIQQLLNTLKRPKRRPLPEFYEDDDIELELAANPKDPNAPKPEGGPMTPAMGEQLVIPSGLPRSLEAAIQRYGSASFKAPAASVLDPNGKILTTLTYGKLQSRSYKVAYALLNKLSTKPDISVKPGERVALVYPNNDAIGFMCAFYGCLFAGVVPVPIEVPLTRRDAGLQQIGFLLGSCGVSVALTSEACLKGLPKTATGEIVAFKGWPRLQWCITDHLNKPPKDWQPPPRLQDDTPAYIEYKTDKDGSVLGVTVTRAAMLAQCRALTAACWYTEGEVMVCVLDFKREVGLWHATLTALLNGMHSIFIPYALMKTNPASWMHMITKYKASVAIVKSRDLHWGLLATRDHRDINLSSLRMLLVADGSNPWSLSSCDQFLAVFQSKGLRADAVCPCAASSETLTISLRRPGRSGANATGRGILSMQGLSYGVVRVDQENSLTSLTLQDCGHVMPGALMVVVKMEGPPRLCKTDEVGEICVSSSAAGLGYWGLQGLSNATFRVQPMLASGESMGETEFVRSGLLGFLGPGGLVFVCGSRDGLMTVTGRKHNTDDIIATVLAVEPMKFIYRGRIGVFSIRVLRDERICVVAEQRPDCSEEESFQWMSRVLQAVDSIHQVGIYCLALVLPNSLPKTPLGGIHLSETRRRFMEGSLHPANVLMCPHTCVTNLPKPREVHHDVGPASVMVGNIVQGNRLAAAQGRELRIGDDESNPANKYRFISEILQWRAQRTSDHVLFTLLGAKGTPTANLTCAQLHKKAERVACLLVERGKVNSGDHVALIYPPGLDLIGAFYGCLYVGAVPVTIRPPHPQNLQTTLPTVRMIVEVSKASVILSNQNVIKLLKSKEAGNVVDARTLPIILDSDDMPKKKLANFYRAPTAEMLAYLDFSVSTTGMLAGIKMSHAATTALCRSMKQACELYPSRHVALCLDPYCGLGFALWCLSSVYSGHHSVLIPPSEVELNPALWLTTVSQYKVRDTFCSYGVMELCTKGLANSINLMKQRGVNLACVRTCVVVAEERPRVQLSTSFSKLFSGLGLSPRAVSTSFGCRVNVAICLQGSSSPDPSTVYVDLRALRNDRVTLVERGAPHSLCLIESGKLLPGVKVIIANPDTKGQCGDSHLGEIWVQAPHNASGYFTLYGDESGTNDHFGSQLVTGNTGEVYARTGYLGFLRRTECVQSDGELHDAVFVVGALEETIVLRGMRYHPIDIENTVMRSHKKIAECAVFTWTNLLVVVAELDGMESEALDLVPLVTSSVLEEHHLIVGVVVVVDPGVVPINSRGEKQRMHLRDGFLADQLDPIYVAYNM